jgi:hypothetical protein
MNAVRYTLRGISPELKARLHAAARATGRDVNQVIIDALTTAYGAAEVGNTDLDRFGGTWVEDAEFDRAVASFREIDHSKNH